MADNKKELNEDELEEVTGGNIKDLFVNIDRFFSSLVSDNGQMDNRVTNNGNKFVCERCGEKFNSKHELTQHIKRFHSSMM